MVGQRIEKIERQTKTSGPMNPKSLADQCRTQIALVGPAAVVTLTIPGRWGKRDTRALWPGGPIARIVSEDCATGRPRIIVQASAQEILDRIEPKTSPPKPDKPSHNP